MIAELAPGSVFAGYRIDGVLGRGGMGVVYRAYDPGLERPVALKLIAPEVAGDPRFRDRFLRETRIAASLEHPHVLPVYAAGEEEGSLYLVTRLVEGEDLKAYLAREAPLPPQRAVSIAARVAGALDSAHARGLVHRDVKPANVLLDASGECYLADFGLTKSVSSTSGLTRTGEFVGTIDYLAPEQIRSQPLDGRADQYALACLLFECLAGEPPFRREGEAQALFAHLHDEPSSVAARAELPAAIDGVLARGLAKEPRDRFGSCSELAAAAGAALGVGVEFRRAPLLPAWVRRRGKRIALLGALVVAAAIAAAVVQLTRDSDSDAIRTVAANAVAAIDPETNAIVAQVPVGRRPTAIAVGEGAVWVLNAEDRTISRIDPETKEEERFATGTTPFDLAVGEGGVWVSSADAPREWPSKISRVDPATGIVDPPIELPAFGPAPPALGVTSGGTSLVVGEGSLWAINPDGTVSRIDPQSGEVVATIQGLDANTITAGEGAVWTANTNRTVSRIDPATNAIDTTIEVAAEGLAGIAVGAGAVWVTDPIGRVVWRIDPGGARDVQKTIPLEFGVVGITFGEGSVWVANASEGTVSRIDPGTDQVVETVDVGNAPFNVAVGEGSVWVTVGEGGTAPPSEEPPPTEGGIVALPSASCQELEGSPGATLLIASDLPLQGASQMQNVSIEAAIRHVLEQNDFRAGDHSLAYQSCDNSTAQAGGWEVEKCAANAQAYAENPAVVAVIGAYNSGCSSIEIPFANRATDGPLAMISPSNNYIGLTRRSPSSPRGELERFYPTGLRNYLRVYPPDDAEAAALAQLAQELGLRRIFVLEDLAADTYAYDLAQLFEKAAVDFDFEIVGRRRWDAEADGYKVLAQRVAATDPDGVFLSGLVYSNGGRLIDDLRAELGPDVTLFAPDGFSNMADLMEIVGPVADGMYVSTQGVPTDRLSPEGLALLEELRAQEPELNDYWALYGAQTAEVLLDAIARSDGTRTSVVEALFLTEVENGIIGSFGFDENGDTTAASIVILRVDGVGPGISHLSEDFAEGATVDRVIEPDLSLVRE